MNVTTPDWQLLLVAFAFLITVLVWLIPPIILIVFIATLTRVDFRGKPVCISGISLLVSAVVYKKLKVGIENV
tara:strand:- start:135 stop:353 length:219 start_codon:yes stop_codon:yes gene_type:complete